MQSSVKGMRLLHRKIKNRSAVQSQRAEDVKREGNVSGDLILQILELKLEMNVSTCYKKSTASKDSEDLWRYLLVLSTSSPHSHMSKRSLNRCLRYVGSMKASNTPDVKRRHQAGKVQVG